MKRLTYKKINNMLTLKKPLVAKDDLLIVSIDTLNLEAVITSVNSHTHKVALKGTKDLNNLKKRVKDEFKSLGVVFTDEVRPGRVLNKLVKQGEEA